MTWGSFVASGARQGVGEGAEEPGDAEHAQHLLDAWAHVRIPTATVCEPANAANARNTSTNRRSPRVAGEAVGFTYGFRAREGDTFTLCENMLRAPHRGQGIARSMHDELIRHREESRAQLLVRRERPRLRALYERWGYQHAGEKLPFPDAPLYDVMVLALRQPNGEVAE
ncbi:GNAT family N-acetyltransferase [Streptomyces sp. NPDC058171]